MATSKDLDSWIAEQLLISKHNLALSISATGLCKERKEFGQRIVPAKGSVLASPVFANWDPEPDYCFHWTRDAAAVMRAVVDLVAMASDPADRKYWQRHFHDMVAFNLALSQKSTVTPPSPDYRARTQKDCRRFLRRSNELASIKDDKLLAEPRFNPDGSVDILRWSRPQLDGPALRALACLAWLGEGGEATPDLNTLLELDLGFTLRNAGKRSIGPWEEANEFGHHYFVLLVQLAALAHGQRRVNNDSDTWPRVERRLKRALDKHWVANAGVFSAQRPGLITDTPSANPSQLIDSNILISFSTTNLPGAEHSSLDRRALATYEALVSAYSSALPINESRPANLPPALGRSLADRYFGGGAWYVTTLAAATFCFQRAVGIPAEAAFWREKGDSWLATVRWLTPTDGSMAEQVDRATKAPRSARHLAWSYASFISTLTWRQKAALGGRVDKPPLRDYSSGLASAGSAIPQPWTQPQAQRPRRQKTANTDIPGTSIYRGL